MKGLFAMVLAFGISLFSVGCATFASNTTTSDTIVSDITYQKIGSIGSGQDGAIYGNHLFHFQKDGSCRVFQIDPETLTPSPIGSFTLDRTDLIVPHSNASVFGPYRYHKNDPYPLLYTNIYNNYEKEQDKKEGTLAVYRIMYHGGKFSSRLVQIIRVDFTEDLTLWKSLPDNKDARIFGNFVFDNDKKEIYAFTMRDKEQVTRFFAWNFPKISKRDIDPKTGICNTVLSKQKILRQFDCVYFNYLQGATCFNQVIYSTEGFTKSKKNPPCLRLVDIRKKSMGNTISIPLTEKGLVIEPEFIDFYKGQLLYADVQGNLYKLNVPSRK